jgi:Anti-sigma-K factor rskA
MSCPGIAVEDYQLYALGLCELTEANVIRNHLADGCRECTREIGRSVVFWYQFALAGSENSSAAPRPIVRERLIEFANAALEGRGPFMRWSWPQAVAAAVALVMFSTLSWYVGREGVRRTAEPPQVAVRQPPPAAAPAPAASSEDIEALKRRLQQAEQALASRPPAPAPGPSVAALEQAVAESRAALAAAQQSLGDQQQRAAALERDLQTQRDLLATAVRERQDAETRAGDLAGERARLADRDRQVRTLTARVQELERENAEYRNVINRQRTDIERSLQLAGLLSSPSLRMVKLQATEKSSTAVGYAFVEGPRVIFYASRLPDLPPGRTYQLWLIRGRAPAIVSGGVFPGGAQQRIVEFRDARLAADITALAVTDEPAGGSPLPTGHKFLIGSSRG